MFDFLRMNKEGVGIKKPINFMALSWFSLVLSIFIFIVFFGTYFYRYYTTGQTFNYSVDFTGGIQTLLKFNKPVSSESLIKILEEKGWPGSVAREFGANEHMIRVKKEAQDVRQEAEKIRSAIQEGLGSDYKVEIEQTDSVGRATGASLWLKSFYAVIISLILMLAYIAFRFFSFSYAMGAIVSLFHDALVILTVALVLNQEISINIIGAILAVLGYSINDTIVIFARVRENVNLHPNMPMSDVINLSLTETLSRTVLTTVSTLLVVIALFIFGGETLRDLSFALLVGILFGIYSTVFIANPVLLVLHSNKKSSAK